MCAIKFTPSRTSRLAQRRQFRHEDPLLRAEPDDDLAVLRLDNLSYPKLGVPYPLPRTESGADHSLFRTLPTPWQSTAPSSASRVPTGGDAGDGAGLELLRNLREEARGHLVLALAVGRTNPGVRERQRLLCPRDPDVRQPTLLLQVLLVHGASMREGPLLHPHHEDVFVLETLRVVQRHQCDPALTREPVCLREQRLLLQKPIQSSFRLHPLVLSGGVHQLLQVLQARLGLHRVLRFKLCLIS